MKEYPTISGKRRLGTYVYAFDKLDGSNIRAEWSSKKGFYKFGRRKGLLDHSQPLLLSAPDLIKNKYGKDLDRIFKEMGGDRYVAFFEFFGGMSEFGSHVKGDDFDVVLIDVAESKGGFIGPGNFLEKFGKVHIPDLVYQGVLTEEVVDLIKAGRLDGITEEGVVCKVPYVKGKMDAFKIKTDVWYDKLRAHCGKSSTLFRMLK